MQDVPARKNYSDEQIAEFQTEWAERRRDQRFGLALFVLNLVFWGVMAKFFKEVFFSIPHWQRMLLMGGPALVSIWIVSTRSHCPACRVVIDRKIIHCPACGVRLTP